MAIMNSDLAAPEAALDLDSGGQYSLENTSDHARVIDLRLVALAQIEASPLNPRDLFEQTELDELTASIRQHGVLQPIKVRPAHFDPAKGQMYRIVVGERRFRASIAAGLETIPAVVDETLQSDKEHLLQALAENFTRADLQPMELARSFHRLHREFGMTQVQIALSLGTQQARISKIMSLLDLPEDVQQQVGTGKDGTLSRTHGEELARLADNPEVVRSLARRTVIEGLSSSALSELVSQHLRERKAEENKAQTAIAVDNDREEKVADEGERVSEQEVPGDHSAADAENVPATVGADEEEPDTAAEGDGEPTVLPAPADDTEHVDPAAPADHGSESPGAPDLVAPKPSTGAPAAPAPKTARTAESPKPAADPEPATPNGFMEAIIRTADYEALNNAGLWPLSAIREHIEALAATQLHPMAAMFADKMEQYNRTDSVFSERETDVLQEMFPDRETTTAEMIVTVLVVNRWRMLLEIQANRAPSDTAGDAVAAAADETETETETETDRDDS